MSSALPRPPEAFELNDTHVKGVAERDPDALAACYEALADPLFRFLRRLCGDPVLAEDLVEETFVELVEYAPTLTGGVSGLRGWMFRAARNNLIDARRKSIRRGDVALDENKAAERADRAPGPEAQAIVSERDAALYAALDELSEDQREVLLLRFAGGLSGPEVAEATGRTVGAVKSLQHRGINTLARLLETDETMRDGP